VIRRKTVRERIGTAPWRAKPHNVVESRRRQRCERLMPLTPPPSVQAVVQKR
jgi:hypothetical protein